MTRRYWFDFIFENGTKLLVYTEDQVLYERVRDQKYAQASSFYFAGPFYPQTRSREVDTLNVRVRVEMTKVMIMQTWVEAMS